MNIDSIFKSYIGRIVAFILTPILVVVVPVVTNAANEVLGTGLTGQQISNVAIAGVVGVAGVAWQWLRNRGNWEQTVLELENIYEAGKDIYDPADRKA